MSQAIKREAMEVIEAIRGRRSINFFEPGREIPDEEIRELLETANLAPSSFNVQPWKVVVVRDPERKKALRKCAMDQPKAEEASAVLIMVADPAFLEENFPRVLDNWREMGYMEAGMRETYVGMAGKLYGEPDSDRRRYAAIKNTALFAMSLMLAARGLGLETHAMDGIDEACLKKEFGIPEDKLVPMLVAVGYLKEGVTLLPRAWRRGLDEFVSHEKYQAKQ